MIFIYCIFIVLIVTALTIIDLKTMQLPNYLTLPMIGVGMLVSSCTTIGFCTGRDALLGALVGYLLIWGVNALYYLCTKKHGMGMGDAKLLAGFGATFGFSYILPILFMASVFGLVGGLLWLKLKKLNHQQAFPFGPYLCFSGLLVMLDIVSQTFLIKTFFNNTLL